MAKKPVEEVVKKPPQRVVHCGYVVGTRLKGGKDLDVLCDKTAKIDGFCQIHINYK